MKSLIIKYLIIILLLAALGSIFTGYFTESQKLIGYGVMTLFFIVFPLFSYYRWKDKNVQDYMLTKENLDKMRKREDGKRK